MIGNNISLKQDDYYREMQISPPRKSRAKCKSHMDDCSSQSGSPGATAFIILNDITTLAVKTGYPKY